MKCIKLNDLNTCFNDTMTTHLTLFTVISTWSITAMVWI